MELIKKYKTFFPFLTGFFAYMLATWVNYLILLPDRPYLLWFHILFAILSGILLSILFYFLDKWKNNKILQNYKQIGKYSPSFLGGFLAYLTASLANYNILPNRPYLLWFHILFAILSGILLSILLYFQDKKKKK